MRIDEALFLDTEVSEELSILPQMGSMYRGYSPLCHSIVSWLEISIGLMDEIIILKQTTLVQVEVYIVESGIEHQVPSDHSQDFLLFVNDLFVGVLVSSGRVEALSARVLHFQIFSRYHQGTDCN